MRPMNNSLGKRGARPILLLPVPCWRWGGEEVWLGWHIFRPEDWHIVASTVTV